MSLTQNGQSVKELNADPKVSLKLNLGSGNFPAPGYENLDIKTGDTIFPLQYEDGSLDEIRASHVLEHFDYEKVTEVIHHWITKLAPGGVLKLAVPNFKWVAEHYLAGHDINVQGYVMGGHLDHNDKHKSIFDREMLTEILRQLGLQDIRPWESDLGDCASLPVSLNIQGTKPGPLPKLNIKCAMSVPRLGFQDNFFCWANSLMPLGILPTKYDGAFWGQCLERVMSEMLELDADYILTVDYDSIFTRQTLETLIRTMHANPHIDALAPIEVKRQSNSPLMTLKDENGKFVNEVGIDKFAPDLLEVDTAHFGLTLLGNSH